MFTRLFLIFCFDIDILFVSFSFRLQDLHWSTMIFVSSWFQTHCWHLDTFDWLCSNRKDKNIICSKVVSWLLLLYKCLFVMNCDRLFCMDTTFWYEKGVASVTPLWVFRDWYICSDEIFLLSLFGLEGMIQEPEYKLDRTRIAKHNARSQEE